MNIIKFLFIFFLFFNLGCVKNNNPPISLQEASMNSFQYSVELLNKLMEVGSKNIESDKLEIDIIVNSLNSSVQIILVDLIVNMNSSSEEATIIKYIQLKKEFDNNVYAPSRKLYQHLSQKDIDYIESSIASLVYWFEKMESLSGSNKYVSTMSLIPLSSNWNNYVNNELVNSQNIVNSLFDIINDYKTCVNYDPKIENYLNLIKNQMNIYVNDLSIAQTQNSVSKNWFVNIKQSSLKFDNFRKLLKTRLDQNILNNCNYNTTSLNTIKIFNGCININPNSKNDLFSTNTNILNSVSSSGYFQTNLELPIFSNNSENMCEAGKIQILSIPTNF